MNYTEFKNRVQRLPVIFTRDLILHRDDKQVIRNQLDRWNAKRLVIKLRRGAYLLNPNDRKVEPSRTYIANQLYGPSYVSMEYALSYYGLIPERVSDITSITAKKTLRFTNDLGTFVYQHIKPDAFRAFRVVEDDSGLIFFIAEPEKAIVDFIYLNMDKFKGSAEDLLVESYRLQNIETLKAEKVAKYAKFFKNEKLTAISGSLCELIKKEGAR